MSTTIITLTVAEKITKLNTIYHITSKDLIHISVV